MYSLFQCLIQPFFLTFGHFHLSSLHFSAMLFGSHGAVYTASICSTFSLMATIIILPIMHNQFQRKISLMLSNVELCKVSVFYVIHLKDDN